MIARRSHNIYFDKRYMKEIIIKLGNCIDLVKNYESKNINVETSYHCRDRISFTKKTKQGFKSIVSLAIARQAQQDSKFTILRNSIIVVFVRSQFTLSLSFATSNVSFSLRRNERLRSTSTR